MTTKHPAKIILFVLFTICLSYLDIAIANTDDMVERLRPCAGCHERQDKVTSEENYAPSIKGKPVEYLYQQLLHYRDGRRVNTVMNKMLAYLSRDYLHDIATYYAQFEVDQYTNPGKRHIQTPENAEKARLLVQLTNGNQFACVACHGGDLRGDGVYIPSLRGLSATYINAQLSSWQNETRHARHPDCMAKVAKSLSGADVAAVAIWIETASESMLAPTPPLQPLPEPCGTVK